MPKRDLGSFNELLADLWAALSPLMRVCGLLGTLGGAWVAWRFVWIGGGGRLLWWVMAGCVIVGTVLGLALGAVLEWVSKKR